MIGQVGPIRSAPPSSGERPAVPPDRALPHLARALDAATMSAVLQASVFADGVLATRAAGRARVQRCEIEWVKYRPGKNCTIAYRLSVMDAANEKAWTQLLCARVFTPGQSAARFRTAQSEDLVRPVFGQSLTHVPEMDMVVWAFPNDSKLAALPNILDANQLRCELLPPVVEAAVGRQWTILDLASDVVQYIPEDTCTVRVQISLARPATAERRELVVYGKIYKEGRGAETYALMTQLWDGAARRAGRLRLARPLAYDHWRHILWQAKLPGTALLEDDLSSPHALSVLGKAAAAVAALHQANVSPPRMIGVSDLSARLSQMKQLLPEVRPSCRDLLDPLVDLLTVQTQQLGDQPTAVLHGDLRLRHLLVDGDEVGLIDVDTLCQGSPWQDLGSFSAAILYKGMLANLSDAVIEKSLTTFWVEYTRRVPWPMSRAALDWHTAVALINERAFRSVTRLQEDKLERLHELIALATRISWRRAVLG